MVTGVDGPLGRFPAVSGTLPATPQDVAISEEAARRTGLKVGDRFAALQRAGVTWADVVEVRSYHTDPTGQLEAMAKVKKRYRASPDPAWSAVGTSALLMPNGITEIALVAHKPKGSAK